MSCEFASVLKRRLDEGAEKGIEDGVLNDGETLEGRRGRRGEKGATGELSQRLRMENTTEVPSETRPLY